MEHTPQRGAYEISIDVAPFDEMIEGLKIPPIDFIKMDIEGAELKALEGAAGILKRNKPQMVVAVEHTSDWLANAQAVRELVLSINPAYRCFAGPYMVTDKLQLAPEVLYFTY